MGLIKGDTRSLDYSPHERSSAFRCRSNNVELKQMEKPWKVKWKLGSQNPYIMSHSPSELNLYRAPTSI